MIEKIFSLGLFKKNNKPDYFIKVNSIYADFFGDIHKSIYSIYNLEVLFSPISIYIDKIKDAISLLREENKKAYLDFNKEIKIIMLQEFFLDDKGYYNNQVIDLKNFIEVTIEFIELYEKIILTTNVIDYNRETLYIIRLKENIDNILDKLLLIQDSTG